MRRASREGSARMVWIARARESTLAWVAKSCMGVCLVDCTNDRREQPLNNTGGSDTEPAGLSFPDLMPYLRRPSRNGSTDACENSQWGRDHGHSTGDRR